MMGPEYSIAEGWNSVEFETDSGYRFRLTVHDSELSDVIAGQAAVGNGLSDLEGAFQWFAGETMAADLMLHDREVRIACEERKAYQRAEAERSRSITLEDIVAELKRREAGLNG